MNRPLTTVELLQQRSLQTATTPTSLKRTPQSYHHEIDGIDAYALQKTQNLYHRRKRLNSLSHTSFRDENQKGREEQSLKSHFIPPAIFSKSSMKMIDSVYVKEENRHLATKYDLVGVFLVCAELSAILSGT